MDMKILSHLAFLALLHPIIFVIRITDVIRRYYYLFKQDIHDTVYSHIHIFIHQVIASHIVYIKQLSGHLCFRLPIVRNQVVTR